MKALPTNEELDQRVELIIKHSMGNHNEWEHDFRGFSRMALEMDRESLRLLRSYVENGYSEAGVGFHMKNLEIRLGIHE